jgi:hypothetical protein
VTLVLQNDTRPVEYDQLRQMETPDSTATHMPIPHVRLVDLVKMTLGMFGHEITAEHHCVTEGGMRYFGMISLRTAHADYEDIVGLRNAHDKSYPVWLGFGARVYAGDQLSFTTDLMIRRRHTANLKRALPGVIGELIEPFIEHRETQQKTFEKYKMCMLSDLFCDHAILSMYRREIINLQRIPEVLRGWDNPVFGEFQDRNVWRLFNAVTYSLAGRIFENTAITPRLHQLLSEICTSS